MKLVREKIGYGKIPQVSLWKFAPVKSFTLIRTIFLVAALFSLSWSPTVALAGTGEKQEAEQKQNPLTPVNLGVQTVPTKRKGKGPGLRVKFGTRETCLIGDMTIIRIDLANSFPDQRLLLSLEPMDEEEDVIEPQVIPITVQALARGGDATFPLQKVEGMRVLGLYICKDSDNERSCRDKRIEPLDEVFKFYTSGKVPRDYKAPDRTYFFHTILLNDGQVQFFSEPVINRSYLALRETLDRQLETDNREREMTRRILQYHRTLKSEPPRVEDDKLLIEIPEQDYKKCRK